MLEVDQEWVIVVGSCSGLLQSAFVFIFVGKVVFAGSCVDTFGVSLVIVIVLFVAFLSIDPEATVYKAIIEKEIALTRPLIFDEIALVDIPIGPVIDAISMFSIEHVVPFILLFSFRVVPDSISISKTLLKITSIVWAIFPVVGSEPLRQSIDKLPAIFIAIGVVLDSLPMFKSVFEFAHVEIPWIYVEVPLDF